MAPSPRMNAADAPPVVIHGGDRACVALLLELRDHVTRLPPGTVIHLIAADRQHRWTWLPGVISPATPTLAQSTCHPAHPPAPCAPWLRVGKPTAARPGGSANDPPGGGRGRMDPVKQQRTDRSRPRRADVADSYDRGAAAYEALWSPVILPPAAALVSSLGLTSQCLVADVGAGTGALLGAIQPAAPGARVVALDASAEMLQVARAQRGAPALLADALALPLAGESVDVVLLAYVLFHLADPVRAAAETARVLRPGGRAGTITWAWERASRADAVWDQVLTGAGVPPGPLRRVDAGLDTSAGVAALLASAGLTPQRIWPHRLRHQWDRSSYWELATGWGANRARLSRLDATTRASALERARDALGRLDQDDFQWEGEVICAVATKSAI
jgi:SAM-dependent methyltransferase